MPAFSVVAVALAVTAGAAPVDPDPWVGGGKLAPFGGSAALTLGAARELDNLGGSGTPSWRDMAWNALGMAAGLGAAWLLNNVVLHRPREWNAAPAQDRPSATTQA